MDRDPQAGTLFDFVRRRSLRSVLVVALLGTACTSDPGPGGTEPPASRSGGPAASGPTGSPTPVELDLRLVKVTGEGVRGMIRPHQVAEPAEAIRRTLEDLYEDTIADPSSVPGHFAAPAREQARRSVDRLVLGPAEPDRAILKLRFLADARGRPEAAFADVLFEGRATRSEGSMRIVQRGDYVLRRSPDGWRITSYEVHRRVPERQTEVAFAPVLPDRGPTFVLVIGSDARPGQSVTRLRADSIHIVGVNPRRNRASIVGIPRDAWVTIPGAGSDKINAALVRGGPELLVDAVERLSGVPIDAYVVVGFDDFKAIVDAVGGFDIRIPYAIDDRFARAEFRPGPEHLDGRDALALSRARHDLPSGDFGRSLNQGRVIVAALTTLRDQVARDRAALLPWVLAGARYLRTDLSLTDVFELVLAATAFEPPRVTNAVVPGGAGRVGNRSVVFLNGRASAMFRDLARDGVVDRSS
ncbi:MAG: LCP family protein [Actinobacteria bacterium]|nr:LCP family protein [Actinomycetota bacterium]